MRPSALSALSAQPRKGRENVETKGRRYLVEGRLQVVGVDGDLVRALCRGNGYMYRLGHNTPGGWYCSCPARGRCAHLVALELVTVARRTPAGAS